MLIFRGVRGNSAKIVFQPNLAFLSETGSRCSIWKKWYSQVPGVFIIQTPYHPCMVYVPTFSWFLWVSCRYKYTSPMDPMGYQLASFRIHCVRISWSCLSKKKWRVCSIAASLGWTIDPTQVVSSNCSFLAKKWHIHLVPCHGALLHHAGPTQII